MKATKSISSVLLILAPGAAHAQYVAVWIAVAALSPLLVLVIALILGFASRSWRTGVTHAGLVVLWVLLFVVAAQTTENDYVIWAPIVLYAAHTLLMLVLVVVNFSKRRTGAGSRAT